MPDDNSVFENDKEEEKYFNYAKTSHLSKDDSEARACYALAFWSLLNKVAPKKADEWSNQIEQLHEEPLAYDEPLIDQLDKEKDKSESRNTEEDSSSPQFFNAESAREALINNAPLRVQEEIARCTEEIKAKAELGLDRMTWKTSHHLYRLDRVLAHELRKLGYEVEFKSQHRIEITWYIDYNQFLKD